jgi:hypothetical protein
MTVWLLATRHGMRLCMEDLDQPELTAVGAGSAVSSGGGRPRTTLITGVVVGCSGLIEASATDVAATGTVALVSRLTHCRQPSKTI